MDVLILSMAAKRSVETGGLTLKSGGGEGAKGKQFVEPTMFTGVNNQMRIAQEEVFGPVLSVIPFEDEEEAVQIGNDINFGLGHPSQIVSRTDRRRTMCRRPE